MSALCGLYLSAHALSGLNIPLCVYLFRHRSMVCNPLYGITSQLSSLYCNQKLPFAFATQRLGSIGWPALPHLIRSLRRILPHIHKRKLNLASSLITTVHLNPSPGVVSGNRFLFRSGSAYNNFSTCRFRTAHR